LIEWSNEWWSYRPADFLMFAPRIYWRLFESLNQALWPLQWLIAAAGLAGLAWAWRRRGRLVGWPMRWALAALGLGWALCAWAFLLQRLAPIHWLAAYVAPAFFVQAAGLVSLAVFGSLRGAPAMPRCAVGCLLLAWALLLHPWLAWASGRPWQQAEVPGLAADPTAIATLGALLCLSAQRRGTALALRGLWAVPLAWCLLSALTLWTMGSALGWVPAGAALLAAAAGWAYGAEP
jgi:Family of unknown function (DUF6064)